MNELRKQLNDLVTAANEDFEKVEKGNNAAGTRLRKTMQDIKTLAQNIRKEVLNLRERTN